MRVFPLLLAAFVVAVALSGCNQPPAPESADTAPTEDGGRTARAGRGDLGDEDRDLRAVELLHTPLQIVGQGPVSFDVQVPLGVEAVDYRFDGGAALVQTGVRIELTGCGVQDQGVGTSGSVGGGYYTQELCGVAEPGAQTLTISATGMVFDGMFILTGYVPANATANATAAA